MRSFFGLLAGAALLLLVSCTANLQETIIPHMGDVIELTAYVDNGVTTKTGIVGNGNGGKNVVWKSGNAISLFFNSGDNGGNKFTTTSSGPIATFTGTISAISGSLSETGGKAYFWGLYPYTASASCDGNSLITALPSTQIAFQGDVADDLLVTVGRSENLAMSFKNACAVIGFTLSQDNISKVTFSGRNNEYVAGEFKASFDGDKLSVTPTSNAVKSIEITPAESSTFVKGKTYYFAILPQFFQSGYSLSFTRNDEYVASYERTTSFTFAISTFYTMTNKDSGLTYSPQIKDLSAHGTANCYIVSSAGSYKFNCKVQGNSTDVVSGTPTKADVLWETFNTTTAPNVGDVIANSFYEDGYIYFSTPDILREGNAVIALKSSDDIVLWSWHIWVTPASIDGLAQTYPNSAGVFMDRNLGALTAGSTKNALSYGLYYQWGRKDPFIALSSSTTDWPRSVRSQSVGGYQDNGAKSLAYSIENPMTFITYNGYNFDWYFGFNPYEDTDMTRWSSEKTKYDPCPPGWKVPISSSWIVAGFDGIVPSLFTEYGGLYLNAYDMAGKDIYYPACGYLSCAAGTLDGTGNDWAGNECHYWAASGSYRWLANCLYVYHGLAVSAASEDRGDYRAQGKNVRCIHE